MEDKGKDTRHKKKGADSKVRLITSTKKGDRGQTRLLSGEKVSKSNLRIEAGGNLDESNAIMGLARAFTENERIRDIISTVQGELVLLGAELSSTNPRLIMKRIELEHISQLEKWINGLQEEVPLAPRFVSPGVNSVSAALDLARSVIRRTERSMVILQEMGQLERAETLKYVNRLGTLLYTLARYSEKVK
ncbi:MAG: cob(I)yrinic acid a,c-diamide adenosyltransferase [Syntrophobacteraceae bacterium]